MFYKICSGQKSRKRPVLTEGDLDDVGTRLEASPEKSQRLLALQCGMAEKCSLGWCKVAKVTALQSYSRT
jgi:hypothetical protein